MTTEHTRAADALSPEQAKQELVDQAQELNMGYDLKGEDVERVARKLAMFMFDTWGDAEGVVWIGLSPDEKDKARKAARAAIAAFRPQEDELREALKDARRYIANCWIDAVATEEERALVAKIDAALEGRSGDVG